VAQNYSFCTLDTSPSVNASKLKSKRTKIVYVGPTLVKRTHCHGRRLPAQRTLGQH